MRTTVGEAGREEWYASGCLGGSVQLKGSPAGERFQGEAGFVRGGNEPRVAAEGLPEKWHLSKPGIVIGRAVGLFLNSALIFFLLGSV